MDRELIENEAEQILLESSHALLTPKPGECLVCYVDRQVAEFGCDNTHRFAAAYRDLAAPRATALLRRLAALGACCCDCEMFMNAFHPASRLWTGGYWQPGSDGYDTWVDAEPPARMPSCTGVRRGSVQPCANWDTAR